MAKSLRIMNFDENPLDSDLDPDLLVDRYLQTSGIGNLGSWKLHPYFSDLRSRLGADSFEWKLMNRMAHEEHYHPVIEGIVLNFIKNPHAPSGSWGDLG
ncbi:MAG TPA: hypothetical protein VIT68_02080 [Candidatus Gracilibacteria bacterium]